MYLFDRGQRNYRACSCTLKDIKGGEARALNVNPLCENENWNCRTRCYWSIVYILFTKSNQDVTLFTRTAKQAEELNETGVTCIRDGRCETVYPPVLPIESMVAQNLDYIFISVKQYHIDDVLPFVEGASSLIFCKTECRIFKRC